MSYDGCHAELDGDCSWGHCPQLKDNEPRETGRSCPLWRQEDYES